MRAAARRWSRAVTDTNGHAEAYSNFVPAGKDQID
jgi:hypothetical protein